MFTKIQTNTTIYVRLLSISKHEANVEFGWQFNLWASPAGGFTGVGIPGTGIVHLTETLGFEEGKKAALHNQGMISIYA